MFGKLHCVFKENTLAVLNFLRCVYNYNVRLCFFHRRFRIHNFFASPYPVVTASRSGPCQDFINVTNLDSKVTKREMSHQNVTDREETYKRP